MYSKVAGKPCTLDPRLPQAPTHLAPYPLSLTLLTILYSEVRISVLILQLPSLTANPFTFHPAPKPRPSDSCSLCPGICLHLVYFVTPLVFTFTAGEFYGEGGAAIELGTM